MKREVLLTATAEQQMHDAAEWYALKDADTAGEWFNGLTAAMESLAENPLQFPLAPENQHLPVKFRQMLYGLGKRKTHRILFVVRQSAVVVHQIRHTARRDVSVDDM